MSGFANRAVGFSLALWAVLAGDSWAQGELDQQLSVDLPGISEHSSSALPLLTSKDSLSEPDDLGALYFRTARGYHHGEVEDLRLAYHWYRKAAEQGHAQALVVLGGFHEDGVTGQRDYLAAVSLYRRAASKGNALAQYNLGVMYANGRGVQQSYEMAKKWYERSAAGGFSGAYTNLGTLYLTGRGVSKDYARARELFSEAAFFGDVLGMYHLGLIYVKGYGVQQDPDWAQYWLLRSSNKGLEAAEELLSEIEPGNTAWLVERDQIISRCFFVYSAVMEGAEHLRAEDIWRASRIRLAEVVGLMGARRSDDNLGFVFDEHLTRNKARAEMLEAAFIGGWPERDLLLLEQVNWHLRVCDTALENLR